MIKIFSTLFLLIIMHTAVLAGQYAVVRLDGSVNPIISKFIVDSIKSANADKMEFMVIQMDTPGGLMGSMRDIIKAIMSSEIPVVVFVFPRGAQAASAGGFIALSAHVAVMAPGTEIGAMHPVSPMLDFMQRDRDGAPAGVMEKKVLNDTVAYAKSLAQKRNRNEAWAVGAVRDAAASTYSEAVRAGVVDFIADDMSDLLRKLNGRNILIEGRMYTFSTGNLEPRPIEMDWKQKMLNFFASPEMIMLLLLIAIAGIGLEFKNPGMVVPGVIGGVSLFIFLMAVRVLPVNFAGLALIALSVVLFILELKVQSYGLLTLGGIASFVFGSMILFPGGYLPLPTIIASMLVLIAFIFLVVRAIMNALKERVTTGAEGMIGEAGVAIGSFSGIGKIKIRGEIWNAESQESVVEGERVVVKGMNGMTLIVKKTV